MTYYEEQMNVFQVSTVCCEIILRNILKAE